MINIQEYLDNAMAASRAEQLKTSDQLTLGEVILKLEAIQSHASVVFDFGAIPSGLDSWRGSYAELAIGYEAPIIRDNLEKLIQDLSSAVGKTFTGYKGGDFLMGKATPLWVANYGLSSVENYKDSKNEYGEFVGIVDVVGKDGRIVLETDIFQLFGDGFKAVRDANE